MKHVYDGTKDVIESCAVQFDINSRPLNLNEIVPVIGMEDMLSRDTRWYSTPATCSLINSPATVRLM